jgi:hypothetical protein
VPLVFRRSLVPAALGLLAALPVHAQSLKLAGYGVRGGVASSRFHGDYGDLLGFDRRLGASASWFMRFRAGRYLSLQPELGWTTRGGKGDLTLTISGGGTVDTWRIEHQQRVDYLVIPLLLRLDVLPDRLIEPYIAAGPAFAALLGSKMSLDIVDQTTVVPNGVRMANIFDDVGTYDGPDFRDYDVLLAGGAGVAIGRGAVRAVLDGRWEHGMLNVMPPRALHARNGSWVVTAGIELR